MARKDRIVIKLLTYVLFFGCKAFVFMVFLYKHKIMVTVRNKIK